MKEILCGIIIIICMATNAVAEEKAVNMDPALYIPLSIIKFSSIWGGTPTPEDTEAITHFYSICSLVLRPWETGYTAPDGKATRVLALRISLAIHAINIQLDDPIAKELYTEAERFYLECAKKCSSKKPMEEKKGSDFSPTENSPEKRF